MNQAGQLGEAGSTGRETAHRFFWRAALFCLLAAYVFPRAVVPFLVLAWGCGATSFALQFSGREWRQPVRPVVWAVFALLVLATGAVVLRS